MLAVVLVVVGVYVYFHLKAGLDRGIGRSLRDRATVVATLSRQLGLEQLEARRPLLERGKDEAQVVGVDGRVIAGEADHPLITPAELAKARTGPVGAQRAERIRLLAEPIAGQPAVVVVTASLGPREAAMESLASSLTLGGPALLLLAAGAGYLLTGAALRPVESMRRRAATISADEPGARLPLPAA
ncbi:MAG: hypothetical protein QOG63_114, partial [Thermoleophilaceae bacterium]|nr:hypothetical protein [Thermoleophilaceae bacterium]